MATVQRKAPSALALIVLKISTAMCPEVRKTVARSGFLSHGSPLTETASSKAIQNFLFQLAQKYHHKQGQ